MRKRYSLKNYFLCFSTLSALLMPARAEATSGRPNLTNHATYHGPAMYTPRAYYSNSRSYSSFAEEEGDKVFITNYGENKHSEDIEDLNLPANLSTLENLTMALRPINSRGQLGNLFLNGNEPTIIDDAEIQENNLVFNNGDSLKFDAPRSVTTGTGSRVREISEIDVNGKDLRGKYLIAESDLVIGSVINSENRSHDSPIEKKDLLNIKFKSNKDKLRPALYNARSASSALPKVNTKEVKLELRNKSGSDFSYLGDINFSSVAMSQDSAELAVKTINSMNNMNLPHAKIHNLPYNSTLRVNGNLRVNDASFAKFRKVILKGAIENGVPSRLGSMISIDAGNHNITIPRGTEYYMPEGDKAVLEYKFNVINDNSSRARDLFFKLGSDITSLSHRDTDEHAFNMHISSGLKKVEEKSDKALFVAGSGTQRVNIGSADSYDLRQLRLTGRNNIVFYENVNLNAEEILIATDADVKVNAQINPRTDIIFIQDNMNEDIGSLTLSRPDNEIANIIFDSSEGRIILEDNANLTANIISRSNFTSKKEKLVLSMNNSLRAEKVDDKLLFIPGNTLVDRSSNTNATVGYSNTPRLEDVPTFSNNNSVVIRDDSEIRPREDVRESMITHFIPNEVSNTLASWNSRTFSNQNSLSVPTMSNFSSRYFSNVPRENSTTPDRLLPGFPDSSAENTLTHTYSSLNSVDSNSIFISDINRHQPKDSMSLESKDNVYVSYAVDMEDRISSNPRGGYRLRRMDTLEEDISTDILEKITVDNQKELYGANDDIRYIHNYDELMETVDTPRSHLGFTSFSHSARTSYDFSAQSSIARDYSIPYQFGDSLALSRGSSYGDRHINLGVISPVSEIEEVEANITIPMELNGELVLLGSHVIDSPVGQEYNNGSVVHFPIRMIKVEGENEKEVVFNSEVNASSLELNNGADVIFNAQSRVGNIEINHPDSKVTLGKNTQLEFTGSVDLSDQGEENIRIVDFTKNNSNIEFSDQDSSIMFTAVENTKLFVILEEYIDVTTDEVVVTDEMENDSDISTSNEYYLEPISNESNYIYFNTEGSNSMILTRGGNIGDFNSKFNTIQVNGPGITAIDSNVRALDVEISDGATLGLLNSRVFEVDNISIHKSARFIVSGEENFSINNGDQKIRFFAKDSMLQLDSTRGDIRNIYLYGDLLPENDDQGVLILNSENYENSESTLILDTKNNFTREKPQYSIGSDRKRFSAIVSRGSGNNVISEDVDISNVYELIVEEKSQLEVRSATVSEIPRIVVGVLNSLENYDEASNLIINVPYSRDGNAKMELLGNNKVIEFASEDASLLLTTTDIRNKTTEFLLNDILSPNIDSSGNLEFEIYHDGKFIVNGVSEDVSIGLNQNRRFKEVRFSGSGDIEINVPVYAKDINIDNDGDVILAKVNAGRESTIFFSDYSREENQNRNIENYNLVLNDNVYVEKLDINNSERKIIINDNIFLDTISIENGANSEINLYNDYELSFPRDIKIDVGFTTNNDLAGSLNFVSNAFLTKPIGTYDKRFKKVNFSDKNIQINNIYANQVNFNQTKIHLDNNININGNINADSATFNLGVNDLLFTNGNVVFLGKSEVNMTRLDDNMGNIIVGDNSRLTIDDDSSIIINIDDRSHIMPNGSMISLIRKEGGSIDCSLDQIVIGEVGPFSEWEKEKNDQGIILVHKLKIGEISEEIALENGNSDIINHELSQSMNNFAAGTDAEKVMLQWGNMTNSEMNDSQVRLFSKDPIKEATNRNLNMVKDVTDVIENHISEVTTLPISQDFAAGDTNIELVEDQNSTFAVADNGYVSGISAGDDFKQFGIWATAFFERNRQKKFKYSAGYKSYSHGAIVGFDTKTSESNVLGVALSAAKSDINHATFKNGDKTEVSALLFSIYSNQQINKNLFVQGVLSIGSSHINNFSLRKISNNNMAVAKSDYTSLSSSVEGLLGYNYLASNYLIITPVIGLDYARIEGSKYKEYGTAGPQLLYINRKYSQKLDLISGLRFTSMPIVRNNFVFTPELHCSVNHDLIDKGAVIETKLDGFPVIPKEKDPLQRTFYHFGLGLDIGYKIFDYTISLDSSFAKKYVSLKGSLKVRVNF